jgi:hypothetical protein
MKIRRLVCTTGGADLSNKKDARAVSLASARQGPETQKENQAGHSSERLVEGHVNPKPVCFAF